MTQITHGMNLEEVEALGQWLQVRDAVTEIERFVADSPRNWVGSDADAFRSWWPTSSSILRPGVAMNANKSPQVTLV